MMFSAIYITFQILFGFYTHSQKVLSHYLFFSIVLQLLGGDNCPYVSIGSANGGTYHYDLRFSLTMFVFRKARSSVFFIYLSACYPYEEE